VDLAGDFGDVLTQDLVNLLLIMLELVGFSSLRTGVVLHYLFVGHEKLDARCGETLLTGIALETPTLKDGLGGKAHHRTLAKWSCGKPTA
jgi:hypothetical protein